MRKKIKDLFDIKKGKKENQPDKIDKKSERYIQIEDLRNDDNIKYCISREKSTFVDSNDIIIAWDGANAGTIAYGLKGVIGSTLARLKPKVTDFNTDFVGRYLISKFKYLQDNCTGATVPHINRTVLENLEIQLPPLQIQKKIVKVLDKAQEVIDLRKKQIESLDELIQSFFYDMFGDPVINPRKWRKTKLENLCDVYRGGSPRPIKDYVGGTVPWIKIGDATSGDDVYLYSTKEHIIEEGVKKSRLVKKGSLIFANCGVSLGFARIIKFDGCIHDGWLSFENIDESIDKLFLLKLLNCYTDYFRKTAPDGTQPNLNTKIMKSFDVIVPPISLQIEFSKKLKNIIKQKELIQESLSQMEDNFNALMQKAFKGELFN